MTLARRTSTPLPGYAAIAAAAIALTALSLAIGQPRFALFFGAVNPLLAVGVLSIAGYPALAFLHRTGIAGSASPHSARHLVVLLLALGAIFTFPPIAIDLALPFAEDINVALPDAVLFYPAIGLVAEIVFHLMPLALVAALIRTRPIPVWALVPAALTEPGFQIAFSQGGAAQQALVFAHIFTFSLVQLVIFRRYGFAAMYGLRLSFYAGWHVLWGTARLDLLF